jgi:hypothetical protein
VAPRGFVADVAPVVTIGTPKLRAVADAVYSVVHASGLLLFYLASFSSAASDCPCQNNSA